MRTCKQCKQTIPPTAVVNGKRQSLSGRSYCLECSPWGESQGYELRKATTKKYNDDEFIQAIKDSKSIREVLRRLEIKEAGGNYLTVKRKIKELGLDVSHFHGKGHLLGKRNTWHVKQPLSEILKKDTPYRGSTSALKRRLLNEDLFERKCYNCGGLEWFGKPMPLELEHKNGDRFDNRIENLTLLCPNCHAFTPTYRRRKDCPQVVEYGRVVE